MAFRKNSNSKDIDYKSRLERKLYLARENPEPIFDLSECNLKTVPNNIFSLCKVFRKEALYLQDNSLSTLSHGGSLKDLVLLKVLDISSNKFTKLPTDISNLVNLEILNISNNQLQDLPDTICSLQNLSQLDVSNNRLKKLPKNIGHCSKLKILNLQSNKSLSELPVSLGNARLLDELLIDSNITYPPQDVYHQGVRAILQFLASEAGEDFPTPTPMSCTANEKVPETMDYNLLQEKIKLLEKLKDEKQRERLALEQRLKEENEKELKMQMSLKGNKTKLVEDLKSQQQSLEAEIAKIQQKKETERALLINELNSAEELANTKVEKFLNYNRALREKISVLSEEQRKMEEQILLNIYSTSKQVVQKNVLDSMNTLMMEEVKRAEQMSQNKRVQAMKTLVSDDSFWENKMLSLVEKSKNDQNKLIETINHNEELQKTAVASLLERSDTRSWELAKQVSMVQSQLAELTKLELTKKRLEVDAQIAEISENRIALTNLLMDLFAQQQERRHQLIETLRKMEGVKASGADTGLFWMEQYQKLLDSKSHQLVEALRNVDPNLINEFFLMGVFHYMPLLAQFLRFPDRLEDLTSLDLLRTGIKSEEDQMSILKAVKNYLKLYHANVRAPSAPAEEGPSAPIMSPTASSTFELTIRTQETFEAAEECVICLDAKSDVIFTPCGHLCCCSKCAVTVTICPLCRTPIDKILQATPQV